MTLVKQFHEAFDQPAPERPPLTPDLDLVRFRMRLIDEEHREVKEELAQIALGCKGGYTPDQFTALYRKLLKELADLRYVVEGTAVALGLPIEEAYVEVHRSNMSKLGPDGHVIRREDGKPLKGPHYTPADMEQFVPDIIEIEETP